MSAACVEPDGGETFRAVSWHSGFVLREWGADGGLQAGADVIRYVFRNALGGKSVESILAACRLPRRRPL